MRLPAFAAALALTAAACGDERPAASPPVAPATRPAEPAGSSSPSATTTGVSAGASEAAYRVVAVPRGGTVAGACRLVGQASPARLDPWPGMGIDESRDDESVSVGERQAFGGCVVLLRRVAAGKAWPEALRDPEQLVPITVEEGRFRPHLLLARVGAPLSFTSRIARDLVVHGYYGPGLGDTAFNFSLAPGTTAEPDMARLKRPGLYPTTDDVRGHFLLWIHAIENPYAEITSAEPRPGRPAGEFRLEGVPPGEYELLCWHEPMDRRKRPHGGGGFTYVWGAPIELRRPVHVSAEAVTTVDFDVPAKAP